MSPYRSDFLATLHMRGFIDNCTDPEGLDAAFREGCLSAYIGFDCTAPSLHVGSLMQMLALRWLQETGSRPIVLMGGGTTRIGDPSGKDETRKLLEPSAIAANMARIQKAFQAVLEFGDRPTDAVVADNIEWLETLNHIDFLRDYGRHFSVNRMLSFDSVRTRLDRESSLSFLEFNYMVLQAYDFVELARRYGCRLQIGGADQWGNIVSGIDLGRRTDGLSLFGLTTPLLTTADGRKMGKTVGGAVWLDAEWCPPFQFWQYWRNTNDADVPRFLRIFTFLPLEEVGRLAKLAGAEINEAKKILANEVTALVHGREAAEQAAETARKAFEEGGTDSGLPTAELTRAELAGGITVAQAFVRAGLAGSSNAAKRLVRDGGARIDGVPVDDPSQLLTASDLASGWLHLTAGRKRHALLGLRD